MSDAADLAGLLTLIRERKSARADKSYTRQLFDSGVERCAKKFGEEAVEAVIASLGGDRTALKNEAADVVYHLLVLLESREVNFEDVVTELKVRMRQSGLEEKASRPRGET
jgi:phosphoribosyl-ATP pyrophosphohydrolase